MAISSQAFAPSNQLVKITGTIDPSETLTIDTISKSSFKSLRYWTSIWTATKTKSFDYVVNNANGTIKDCMTNIVGLGVSCLVDVVDSGLDVELKITNNEAGVVSFELYKLKIGC